MYKSIAIIYNQQVILDYDILYRIPVFLYRRSSVYFTLARHNMTDALRLQFKPDDDGTGELFAEIRTNGFAGTGSAWFNESELVEFAEKLAAAFPLPADSPLGIRGGFWSTTGSSIEQEHVSLTFYPVGGLGRVGCRVVLCTPLYEHDRPEGQSSLAAELLTTYELLGAFARALELLVTRGVDEAVLEAAS